MLLISLGIMLLFMALGLPIYLSLMISGLYILFSLGVPPAMIVASLFDGVFKFTLLAVPFFLFAGCLIDKTSFSEKLLHYLAVLTRGIRGGLSISGVAANEFFGAISGSSAAATGTIGKMLYSAIAKENGESFALGLLTSAGALAIVMPPSITMILYAAAANVSTGTLFLTGIVPALLIGLILTIYIIIRSRRNCVKHGYVVVDNIAKDKKLNFKDIVIALSVLFLPVLILGGIYGGYYTPTESAAVSVVYVALVAYLLMRELDIKTLLSAAGEGLKLTAQIFIIIAASCVFSQALTMAQVPQQIVQMTSGLSPATFMIMVNLVLLFTGMFFDPASAVLVLTPILAPIATSMGIDLIYLGIVVTVNIAIGMFTPPFGLNLFVSQAVFKKPLDEIVKSITPFWAWYFIALIIITFVPVLYMWIPGML